MPRFAVDMLVEHDCQLDQTVQVGDATHNPCLQLMVQPVAKVCYQGSLVLATARRQDMEFQGVLSVIPALVGGASNADRCTVPDLGGPTWL